jgi:hypothetical protein
MCGAVICNKYSLYEAYSKQSTRHRSAETVLPSRWRRRQPRSAHDALQNGIALEFSTTDPASESLRPTYNNQDDSSNE